MSFEDRVRERNGVAGQVENQSRFELTDCDSNIVTGRRATEAKGVTAAIRGTVEDLSEASGRIGERLNFAPDIYPGLPVTRASRMRCAPHPHDPSRIEDDHVVGTVIIPGD